MEEIEVGAVPLERLQELLAPERAELLTTWASRARASFGNRVLWHVSATAQGGGVAEMLGTLLAYGRGAGIDTRWVVLTGDPEFFTITKRLHNHLHGDPGDGGPLGAAERAHYVAVLVANLDELLARVSPRDIVLLHDPQTAGLADALRGRGLHVAWRSHIGTDQPSELSTAAWDFLRPFVEPAEALIFSRRSYAPPWADPGRVMVITPSIDPFSNKNRLLPRESVHEVLATVGLVAPGAPGDGQLLHRDGSTGLVRPPTRPLVLDGPPPPYDARLFVQVSRWDRLKDMPGVMAAFALLLERRPGERAHLMLAGPATSGVSDDPEGASVLADCRDTWRALPAAVRDHVHLAAIPMEDVDENAIVVNAVQRHAFAVVQKSLAEGFGLTVTEAMWKARPVVASRVGGIQDQIVDGRDGLLVDDPHDLAACAAAFARLLDEPGLAERLGTAAQARVLRDFVGDRHLEQYADLFGRLVLSRPIAPAAPSTPPSRLGG
jgi:trehalose synthase